MAVAGRRAGCRWLRRARAPSLSTPGRAGSGNVPLTSGDGPAASPVQRRRRCRPARGLGGYEVALALRWVSIGALPGEGAPWSGPVEATAASAIVLGIGVAAACLRRPRNDWVWLAAVSVPAAAFVIARLYTYDPYYAPTLRRMSDDGLISPGWVFLLGLFAIFAVAVSRFAVSVGAPLVVLVLLLLPRDPALRGRGALGGPWYLSSRGRRARDQATRRRRPRAAARRARCRPARLRRRRSVRRLHGSVRARRRTPGVRGIRDGGGRGPAAAPRGVRRAGSWSGRPRSCSR